MKSATSHRAAILRISRFDSSWNIGTYARTVSSFWLATAIPPPGRVLRRDVASERFSLSPPMSVPLATVPRGVVRVGQRSMAVVEPLPLTIVRSGRTLVRQGDATAGPWLIETGILRASLVTSDGRELVVDLLGPGDVAGAPAGRRCRRADHGSRGARPPSLRPGVRRRVARRRHADRAPPPGSGGPVRPPGSGWDGHPHHASPGRPGRARRHVARDRQPRAAPADRTGA